MLKSVLLIALLCLGLKGWAQEKTPFAPVDQKDMKKVLQLAEQDSLSRKYFTHLLGVPVNFNANLKLYDFIQEWMGTPYRFGGDSKGGIDCSRFVNRAYEFVYDSVLGGKTSRGIYKELTEIVSTDELKEGDFVFFKIGRRYISHIGIYLGDNKFVHASRSEGVTISDLNEPYWKRYFYKAGRLIGQYF
ncbi:lipoprotein Spr [Anseongella ginsenosidimutans]|uniref:Lipoprotein Spr n=1 Tax=Anseongella ginsenosidimutans TaxID=496056 RepID=A0A4R3KUX1_9SPHI|nr:NlpC/P60 family protein [Anseongella ginsenosidimutans]QEC51540.1 glycoside hydrolase [Anseongella ginsenosidimutans]TCS88861.1 lipoprotein Spr [Anseongella ginsenosidimutans]